MSFSKTKSLWSRLRKSAAARFKGETVANNTTSSSKAWYFYLLLAPMLLYFVPWQYLIPCACACLLVVYWKYFFANNKTLLADEQPITKEYRGDSRSPLLALFVRRRRQLATGKETISDDITCKVECRDAISWCNEQTQFAATQHVVTSLPDFTETSMAVPEWKTWFIDAVELIVSKLAPDTCAIFYQTDSKITDKDYCLDYIDKSYLVMHGFEKAKLKNSNLLMVWHKVMLIAPLHIIKHGRPTYTHMICVMHQQNNKVHMCKHAMTDVIERGEMFYSKGMGIHAALASVTFCKLLGAESILDPFCGQGTVLLSAKYMGMHSLGIDISHRRARNATKNIQYQMENFVKLCSNEAIKF